MPDFRSAACHFESSEKYTYIPPPLTGRRRVAPGSNALASSWLSKMYVGKSGSGRLGPSSQSPSPLPRSPQLRGAICRAWRRKAEGGEGMRASVALGGRGTRAASIHASVAWTASGIGTSDHHHRLTRRPGESSLRTHCISSPHSLSLNPPAATDSESSRRLHHISQKTPTSRLLCRRPKKEVPAHFAHNHFRLLISTLHSAAQDTQTVHRNKQTDNNVKQVIRPITIKRRSCRLDI